MLGLFDAGSDFEGKRVVEKRGLFFPSKEKARVGGGFEVRVFRAKARKRVEVGYGVFRDLSVGDGGVE